MSKYLTLLFLPFVLLLERLCEATGRVIKIYGRPGEPDADKIYLVRYYLLPKGSPWQIYIHRFMRSDHDVPHDHPFDFLSFVMTKGYREQIIEREAANNAFWVTRHQVNPAGSVLIRQADHAHKVIIDGQYDWEDRRKAPLTVIIRSPRYRDWGFLPPITGSISESRCVREWYKWTDYLGIDEKEAHEEAV